MAETLLENTSAASAPVTYISSDDKERAPHEATGLCLSGGGYRAMLFHAGTLIRLNEAGVLPTLRKISSVSGGSITAGVLALNWSTLKLDQPGATQANPNDFLQHVVDPIRAMASTTIDKKAVFGGIFWFGSINSKIVKALRKHLFGRATLQGLPDQPRFVINATNVQSGALWRFSKRHAWDWKVGKIPNPKIGIAEAVAASAAFPPVLSPARFTFRHDDFEPGTGDRYQDPPFTTKVVLSDGGVYDNLGLETVWKSHRTVLVSDAGAPFTPAPNAKSDWARHSYRIIGLVDNQVRARRKIQLINSFKSEGLPYHRHGAYWGIGTDIGKFDLPDALPCPIERTTQLAQVPTRLAAIDKTTQERLINWGYAVCDGAIRRHWQPNLTRPDRFPYPHSDV